MILYDFQCTDCGAKSEAFGKMNDKDQQIPCECGGQARRVISPVRFKLEGISGDFPTASDQWVKQRQDRMKWEKRHDRQNIE